MVQTSLYLEYYYYYLDPSCQHGALIMFIALVAGAALVPLHSARAVAPCRSPLRTAHRAGIARCQAQQPDQQPPGDEQITSFTDEDGVNRLIGRKIESPSDWIEARSMSKGTPQPLGEPSERGCCCGLWAGPPALRLLCTASMLASFAPQARTEYAKYELDGYEATPEDYDRNDFLKLAFVVIGATYVGWNSRVDDPSIS